jgi:hypothetical protein
MAPSPVWIKLQALSWLFTPLCVLAVASFLTGLQRRWAHHPAK